MNTKVVPVGMLPCPFCGETPDIETWHGGKPTKHMVSCINDECSCAPQCTGQTHAEAIARWNTRVASPALQERRQEQRRSKTDNDLAELYARRDKDRRAVAPMSHRTRDFPITDIAAAPNAAGQGQGKAELICPMTSTVCYDPGSNPGKMCHSGYCRKQFHPATLEPAPLKNEHGESYVELPEFDSLAGSVTAPNRLCSYDHKPCPLPVTGRGPGASQCEQNGMCQSVDFDKLPTIKFELKPALSKESKLPLSAEQIKCMDRAGPKWCMSTPFGELCDQALAAIELERKLKIAEAKNKGTLANNLCPDHRDKQIGKMCLACTIENSERENVELKQRLKLAENLRSRTRIEGEEVGAPHCKED